MRISASIVDGGEGLHTIAVHSKTMEPQYLGSVTRLNEASSSAITFLHTNDSMGGLLAYLI